ncbi:MAG: FixH family protein [Bacteroidota bacterium]|jgi:hypothetical protein
MSKSVSTWGRNIVIVYALFACGTLAFVGFAMTQRVDLTSEHYYEDALRHDEVSAARYRARALGARVAHEGESLSLLSSQQLIVDGDVVFRFRRADDPSLDRQMILRSPDERGYVVMTHGLKSGVWRVEVRWTSHSKDVQIDTVVRVES